ncbi:unnamed protein product [Tetraodon nigroviridis]|uniref:(spotted green pufferfish) hypothetical protein n=1 Tax=Tetraodon nigroviridis TaxID=99883 RepID=Q4S734_TETNG|nr:unnamed protein product [Tetraodon nigroviridis]
MADAKMVEKGIMATVGPVESGYLHQASVTKTAEERATATLAPRKASEAEALQLS